MGIDLRRDMHVRARRSGARGVVLRHWRHTNGHIWAEVRFVNGDTATVRSTHLERITLTEEEQRELSSQSAGSLTDPLELMQRTIDRSIKVTGDCGTEITNAFDEILKPDGTPLTEVELRTWHTQQRQKQELKARPTAACNRRALVCRPPPRTSAALRSRRRLPSRNKAESKAEPKAAESDESGALAAAAIAESLAPPTQ